MLAAIQSAAVCGIDAVPVTVEVDVATGLPQWTLVGLAAAAVRESRERVGAALANAGFALPPRRVTVNLAPADLRKEGTAFDLPIALALLVANGGLPASAIEGIVAIGELGLDGSVRPVRGVLPVARALRGDRKRWLVVPAGNADEGALARPERLAAPATLAELVMALRRGALTLATSQTGNAVPTECLPDLADVRGQPVARRGLEIAAAGLHNALFRGPPGAGKTMLARRVPGILPPLTDAEQLDVVAVHSVAGLLTPARATSRAAPFRAPHHTTSVAGLIGGGAGPRPGEVSLAHHGVLFLDELLETPRHVLDALRQPLEDGHITIARALQATRFPAQTLLICATNPCPCGMAGEPGQQCRCSPSDVARYHARLSGPLADRIDLHVHVGRVPIAALDEGPPGEASAVVRARVIAARAHAASRRDLGIAAVDTLRDDARRALRQAAERWRLSARAYHRTLRVARTIADLAGTEAVTSAAVAEALQYRPAVGQGGDRGSGSAAG